MCIFSNKEIDIDEMSKPRTELNWKKKVHLVFRKKLFGVNDIFKK